MRIGIASGKGGTGKTALALMLAVARPQSLLVDCDVEEPNCHLFLQPQWSEAGGVEVNVVIPLIDAALCDGCGACSAVCMFNAIAIVGKQALVFDELCHSCGGCRLACSRRAISEVTKTVGIIRQGVSGRYGGIRLLSGELKVGTPSAIPIIKKMQREIAGREGDILIDCPPGTSCSMVSSVQNCDFCVLVTEPTPFGRHDLELAMNITALLRIPTGVVINKSDGGDGDHSIESFCMERQTMILAKIPHSLTFAAEYAAGQIPLEFASLVRQIWEKISETRGHGE